MSATTIEPSVEQRTIWPVAALTYLGFIALCALALPSSTASMVSTWALSSTYHHGFFVAPLALWMIWRDAALNGWPPFATSLMPITGAVASALLWLVGHAAGFALLEQIAFVSLLISGVAVIFGMAAFRRWLFPLLFLYFMVPFGEVLIPALQDITASMIVSLLTLTGIPSSLDDVMITTPAGVFHVAQACAGLRFLIAAGMVATLFSYLSFSTWRKRASFIVFALALAVLANGVRAFAMVYVATLTNMRLAIGADHLIAGWVFYLGVFVILIIIGRRFADTAAPAKSRAPGIAKTEKSHYRLLLTAPVFLTAIAISVYAHTVINRPVTLTPPTTLSLFNAPGWRITAPAANWRASLSAADRTAFATYATADNTIYFATGYFTHDRPGAEIINFNNQPFDRHYWRRIAGMTQTVYAFGRSKPVDIDLLDGPGGARLAALGVYWIDGKTYTQKWRMKVRQARAKLAGRNPRGGLIIIAAPYVDDPAGALSAIRAFTVDMEPLDAWLARIDMQTAQ